MQVIGELRGLGATEEEILTQMLPRFVAGDQEIGVEILAEVLQERTTWRRRLGGASPDRWSDPYDEVARPIERGLFLARHADRLPAPGIERLVASLATTRTAVDELWARVAAGDDEPCAQVLELVQVHGGEDYDLMLARAWLFGRLPHAALERRNIEDTLTATRLFRHLQRIGAAGCRRHAAALLPEIAYKLPGTTASDHDVAQGLVELVYRYGFETELWRRLTVDGT